jgi:hypothetical protein
LTSALGEGERSDSHSSRFISGERAPGTHCIRGLVGLRFGPGAVEWRKSITFQSVEQRAAGWMGRVQFPTVKDFSLLHNVKTGSEARPASYPIGTGRSFLGRKAAEA